MTVIGDIAREMDVNIKHVQKIFSQVAENILYQKVFGYQFEDSEPRLIIEKALAKTYTPLQLE